PIIDLSMLDLSHLRSLRVGLALSGGSVRGIAHIGVIKALAELGIHPCVVTGTSAGSLVGAGMAAGMGWQGLTAMAHDVFWPSLLNGRGIESFCRQRLPLEFADLSLPFAAVATATADRQPRVLLAGNLASAINASCALVGLRWPVLREGEKLKDGGISCVLPTEACRKLGAEFVIASDVWGWSAFARQLGFDHARRGNQWFYPNHYLQSVQAADLVIQPRVPLTGYVPGRRSTERLIRAGEVATRQILT
ncbi:MAG: patatin-like phospholipase family protein, partial [Terriglobales bacterium]